MLGAIERRSPAKLNLFLKIIGKRPDGYHDLVSLMCCIGLSDRVLLRPGAVSITVACSYPGVPEDCSNLAARAAELFYARHSVDERVAIKIEKKIPPGAGLGGGSSNAAAVLNGLNDYYDRPFSDDQLIRMGTVLGADVPFFLFGRPALAEGIGERLTAYVGLASWPVVVIYPGFSISTADAYKKLNLRLTKCENHLKSLSLIQTEFVPAQHLYNDFEAVVIPGNPEIEAVKRRLLENGAMGALMAGSGSGIFGIFSDFRVAQRASKVLAPRYGDKIFVTHLLI